ncbi:MAG: glycosyltransferase [Bacteroidia bacterium]|nr:glycosyltransferase [Bacteroidia bacterium]
MLISMQMSFLSFGQFGNKWFDSSQRYFTFKIGQNGVYRLNYNTLSSHGIPVDNINPKNIQIFKNGEEQYLYVNGQEDNSFDADDFIEFYATKNDGSLDTDLYKEPSNQPNTYQSLFTDTSNYYFTWTGNISDKRITSYYNNNYDGKIADSYFMDEQIVSFKDYFFSGVPNQNNSSQQFSEYTNGEGFGRWIWSSQPAFKLDFPQVFSNGPNAEFEILAFSANHNINEISNGYNHELSLSLDNKENTLASKKSELNNQPAIRPQWYVKLREAQLARNDLKIEDSNILVFPEAYGSLINQVFPSNSKVIYNQGCYNSFRKFPLKLTKSETPYTHSNTLATLVKSDDAINYLKLAFGNIPIFKIHHYINTIAFKPTTKKKQIIYISRKNVEDIKQIIQINALRNNLNDWVIKDLNHSSHEEIILAMNESSIFLSSNLDEGFSLPSIEAMASGCLVIGYSGKGGKEYFKPEFSMPVPEKDIQKFAIKLEEGIQKIENQPQFLDDIAQKARTYIEGHYSEVIEKQDIKNSWDYILRANSNKSNA